MVRDSSGKRLKLLLSVLAITFGLTAYAGDLCAQRTERAERADPVEEKEIRVFENTRSQPIVLKMMVVNPSKKHTQIFPMKAYLPSEVKPEYILDKQDLGLGYDSAKGAYYVEKDIELEPGEAVLKAITIQDIWFVSNQRLNNFTLESHELMKQIQGTDYEEQARLLMVNIETLLLQIFESQNDINRTPDQHISAYRENLKKLKAVQWDLTVLERFSSNSGGDLGFLDGSGSGLPVPNFLSQGLEGSPDGTVAPISGIVLWRIVFLVLAFMGIVSLLFFGVWHHKLRIFKGRKRFKKPRRPKRTEDAVQGLNLEDFFQEDQDSGNDAQNNDAA